jgi:uroporphyrinogen-III synthase
MSAHGSEARWAHPGMSVLGARHESGDEEHSDLTLVSRMADRISAAAPLEDVLNDVVVFVTAVVRCDSCFIYVLEDDELILRASKNPHPEVVGRLGMKVGQGITGWVAEHREPVVVAEGAYQDSRFKLFNELPEDRFEAFLSAPLVSGGRLVGVINVQDRARRAYSKRESGLIATLGYLVGAEVERARLESENARLAERLEARKIVERAKGILQRELKIGEEEAYLMLQRQSQQRRKSMREIAEAIVLSQAVRRSAPGG